MPTVTAFIDGLREAFGREVIDQAIAGGIKDGTFHAAESGHVVGAPVVLDPERTVRLDQMSPWNEGIHDSERVQREEQCRTTKKTRSAA